MMHARLAAGFLMLAGAPSPALAQAAASPADRARAVHALGFADLPSDMLVGFGLTYLKDVLQGSHMLDAEAESAWPDTRIRALLAARFAPYADHVDSAIFESIGSHLSAGHSETLLAHGRDPARAAALRCVMTSTPGPDGPLWDSCASQHGIVFDAASRAAGNAYIAALNGSITERPTNAGLGAAVCATAQEIAGALSADGLQRSFTSLSFGIGEDSAWPCTSLRAEAARLWPATASEGSEP